MKKELFVPDNQGQHFLKEEKCCNQQHPHRDIDGGVSCYHCGATLKLPASE